MKELHFRVNDAMYDALMEQCIKDGQVGTRDLGRGYVLRKALKYWLNKAGHSSTDLDRDDAAYAVQKGENVDSPVTGV